MHVRTRTYLNMHTHTQTQSRKGQTNIDFIILVSKSEYFFKYQRSTQIQLNNDYVLQLNVCSLIIIAVTMSTSCLRFAEILFL